MLKYVTLEISSSYINLKHLTNFDGNFIKISVQDYDGNITEAEEAS